MRILHVKAKHLFMANQSEEIYDVYIKDEMDKEIERLGKVLKDIIAVVGNKRVPKKIRAKVSEIVKQLEGI